MIMKSDRGSRALRISILVATVIALLIIAITVWQANSRFVIGGSGSHLHYVGGTIVDIDSQSKTFTLKVEMGGSYIDEDYVQVDYSGQGDFYGDRELFAEGHTIEVGFLVSSKEKHDRVTAQTLDTGWTPDPDKHRLESSSTD